jgi:hypothetical protein
MNKPFNAPSPRTNQLLDMLFKGHVPITATIEAIDDTGGYIMLGQLCIQWGVKAILLNNEAYVDRAVDFGIDYETTTGLFTSAIFEGIGGTRVFNVSIKENTLATTGVTFVITDIDQGNQSDTLDLFWWAIGVAKKQ